MPGPVAVLGIPALVAFFAEIFKSAINWFFTKGFKKVVYFTAFAGAIYLAISALFSALSGFLTSLLSGMPEEIQMLGYILPSNTGTCLAAIIGFELAGLTYLFAVRAIGLKMDAVK